MSGVDRTVYDILLEKTASVAREGGSTVFEVSVLDIGTTLSWTKEELGGIAIISGGKITEEAKEAVSERLDTGDLSLILSALQQDQPYGMYWFDKVGGASRNVVYSLSASSKQISISKGTITFSFSVAQGYGNDYVVDTAEVSRAQAAAENARAIVDQYESCTDREKLTAYKNEICALTSYNSVAANSDGVYGDPWQAVYVFDGDDSTSVVCEGYAKAFEYLCDMSSFNSSEVSCVSVTGQINGGGHMWNIVTLEDGKNFLADITNCDTGSDEVDNRLFLVGYSSGSVSEGYEIKRGGSYILYTYDSKTQALMTVAELTLAPFVYEGDFQYSRSLTLKDNINVNFYFSDLADGTAAEDYDIVVTFNGVTTTYNLASDAVLGEYGYGPEYKLVVAQAFAYDMTKEISLSFRYNGVEFDSTTYSVQTYFLNQLEKSTKEDYRALYKAGLDYGANAQLYFNVDVDNLANATTNPDNVVSAVRPENVKSTTGSVPAIDASSVSRSLICGSETSIKVYFCLNENYSIDELGFACDGYQVTQPVLNGSEYSVKITGIKSYELYKDFDLVITQGDDAMTVTYSPYAYANAKWESAAPNLAKLVQAMVVYGDAAKAIWA